MKKKKRKSASKQLLYNRADAARLLGISVRQIEVLEKDFGLLEPVRLTPSPTGKVLYRRSELMRLARGNAAEARHG